MAINPSFSPLPRTEVGQVSAANALRDGTGTTVALWTAPARGSKIEEIQVKATVTTTAGMVRIFLSNDGGTTRRLIREFAIPVATVSASVQAAGPETVPALSWTPANLVLNNASSILYASTHNAEVSNVFVHGADFG